MKQARIAAVLVVVNLALALILSSVVGQRGVAPPRSPAESSGAPLQPSGTPMAPSDSTIKSAYALPPVDLLAGLLPMMDDRSLALTASQKAIILTVVQRLRPEIGRNTFLAAELPTVAQAVLRPEQWKAVGSPPPGSGAAPPGSSDGGLLGPSFSAALQRILKVAEWTEAQVPEPPTAARTAPAQSTSEAVLRGLATLDGSLALTRDQARALAPYLMGRKKVLAQLRSDVQALVDALRTEQKQYLLAFHAKMIAGQAPSGISPEKLYPELMHKLQP